MNAIQTNARALQRELAWFESVLEARTSSYFSQAPSPAEVRNLRPPDLQGDVSDYARLVDEYAMGFDERLVLILALAPHIRPQVLDTLFMRNKNLDRAFTEFGGWQGKSHAGFLPTCQTAVFLLAGDDIERRLDSACLFDPEHYFRARDILRIEHQSGDEPFFAGALHMSAEYLDCLTTGVHRKPDFGAAFPAKRITTPLGWSDLVLAPEVSADIDAIKTWIAHSSTILQTWGLGRTIKPGYRSLFHGPPGTGKTLTATLIGQAAKADVYRIDLSMVVSKYIGETEKNLANVFDQAQRKNWILFFDEADALFGKRTETSSSNDRYANQEVSYLLQRVEDFPGTVILATNLKANIDAAFSRRFQSMVYFPMPDAGQRYLLWHGILNGSRNLDPDVDLREIAETYELAGGAIINVVRYAAINALRLKREAIARDDLIQGIGKERIKDGWTG